MLRGEARFAPPDRLDTPHHFSDCELVQFVTCMKATEAHELLRKFGGASGVIGASDSEMAAQGINRTTARRIRAFQEAAAAYHWRKVAKRPAPSSWNDLLDFL